MPFKMERLREILVVAMLVCLSFAVSARGQTVQFGIFGEGTNSVVKVKPSLKFKFEPEIIIAG